jgi:hypothetical protein
MRKPALGSSIQPVLEHSPDRALVRCAASVDCGLILLKKSLISVRLREASV